MADKKDRCCEKCIFSDKNNDVSFCRRYPPKMHVVDGKVSCFFPIIGNPANTWCGEFKANNEPEKHSDNFIDHTICKNSVMPLKDENT